MGDTVYVLNFAVTDIFGALDRFLPRHRNLESTT